MPRGGARPGAGRPRKHEPKPKGKRGGARPGAGRPALPTEEHIRRGTYREERHGQRFADEHLRVKIEATDAKVHEVVGLSPRRRLLLGEEHEIRTDGLWIADFCARFCVLFEGPFAGQRLIFYPGMQEFMNDAFAFDDNGRRLYHTALLGIPRKCAKSHSLAGVALALGSPCEGEPKPEIIIAAGSDEQADETFEPAKLFVHIGPELTNTYQTWASSITCEANLGSIYRVSADGRLRHGANPYAVIADELHAWTTPKQVELWAALKTAFGARADYFFFILTTAGWDLSSILGEIYSQARFSPLTEVRSDKGPGGFVYRDPETRTLMHWYGIAPETEISDIAAWKLANPAPWRTEERIAVDLADPWVDESTKRRLYGNQWTSAKNRWISAERWAQARDPSAGPDTEGWIPDGAPVYMGGDAAITYDTTALAWAWKNPETGKIRIRVRVWAARAEAPAHEHVVTGRMDNEKLAEPFVRDKLVSRFGVREFAYDPRYFEGVAQHLAADGMVIFPVEPGSKWWRIAVDAFYKGLEEGTIEHDGDPIFAQHIAAVTGRRLDRGWYIDKANPASPIDAVTAAILAHWRASRTVVEPWVFRA